MGLATTQASKSRPHWAIISFAQHMFLVQVRLPPATTPQEIGTGPQGGDGKELVPRARKLSVLPSDGQGPSLPTG